MFLSAFSYALLCIVNSDSVEDINVFNDLGVGVLGNDRGNHKHPYVYKVFELLPSMLQRFIAPMVLCLAESQNSITK